MIIKNLTRKSNGDALIEYIFRYIKDERDGKADPFMIRHNVHDNDIKSFIAQFNANAQQRLPRDLAKSPSTTSYSRGQIRIL